MSFENDIKEFYSKIKFPGPYSLEDIKFYDNGTYNPYLKILIESTKKSFNILDIGCGNGFIVNILARQNPNAMFTAIDFSDSIDYAREFTKKYRTENIVYYKQDFLTWNMNKKYDLVICNGVLHHIPRYNDAIVKINKLSADKLIVGVYNPYGKLMKKIFKINYKNHTLYLDQEECPFELTFSDKMFRSFFPDFNINKVHPSIGNNIVDLSNILNYANGGLTLYQLQRKTNGS